MSDKAMDTYRTNDAEQSTALRSCALERSSSSFPQPNVLGSEIHLPALATQRLREIDHYRRGMLCTKSSSVELFSRAIVEDYDEARLWVQYCFGGLVRGWLQRHPQREAACRLRSEETYVTLTFERFWQATNSNQRLAFNQLTTALQYLHTSLDGVILDILRTYAQPRDVSWPETAEQHVEESLERKEVWEVLKTILTNPYEQRLAYLLFHCCLSPREIIRLCPEEWRSLDEISSLRCSIVRQFLRHADYLRWRLG